jgi:hypothetical protein
MSALVLEDLVTRQIRFFRAYFFDETKEDGGKRLKLVQLGMAVNKSKMTESHLLKFRSVIKMDPRTKKIY